MIQLIYLFCGFIVSGIIIHFGSKAPNPDVVYVLTGIGFVVFAIWIGIIISEIQSSIKEQLQDFHSLDVIRKDKQSHQAEMDAYNQEMKEELVTKYREFEEKIMDSIKDSKIIATILKESSYATVLKAYHSQIKSYLRDIHRCDRTIEEKIKNMKVRQDDSFYGYGKFIPSNIRYIHS